jgi:hypothetical protein
MHPELYYPLHQQRERELGQTVAFAMRRREAAPAEGVSGLDAVRRLTVRVAAVATGLRSRVAALRSRALPVEPRAVACC